MEDTDQLLFASLQQFGFNLGNKKITSLFDVDGDILRSICFQFLEFMGSKVTINSMKGQQKFRQSTQISEELKNLCNLRIDINSLLSPSKDDLRKIVVAMLQKISMHEEGDNPRLNISQRGGAQAFDSYEDKIRYLQDQRRKQILNNWVNEEWIHPALGNNKFNQFRMYDNELVLESNSLSNKLIIDIINGKMKHNLYASLAKIIENRALKAQIDENEVYADVQKISEQRHLLQIGEIKKQVATEVTKASKKKVNRIAEQFTEQPQQTEEEVKQQLNEEKQTIFNLEMQFQEEQTVHNPVIDPQNEERNERTLNKSNAEAMNSSNSMLNNSDSLLNSSNNNSSTTLASKPNTSAANSSRLSLGKSNLNIGINIDELKTNNAKEISTLSQKYEELQNKKQKYSKEREKMETNIQQKTEEAEVLKEQNKQTKKDIENMEMLIKELETKGGSSELKREIKELEQDIEQIEIEWKEYQETDIKKLEELKDELSKKKEKRELIKDKIKRIDTELQQVIQDLQMAYEKKVQLVEDYKRMPQGGNRQEYIKKIMEIKKNYDKQRGDIQKIIQDVKSVEESIQYYQGTLERHMNELEAIYNTDAKKNESLSKQIFKIYQEYRSIFEQTVNNLREVGNKMIESRSIEAKTVLLATKHYDQSLDKLKQDIEEIRQENMKLQKTVKN
ncbi:hypothetical protein ABPG74_013275 [Tetrahymena malaccensis]